MSAPAHLSRLGVTGPKADPRSDVCVYGQHLATGHITELFRGKLPNGYSFRVIAQDFDLTLWRVWLERRHLVFETTQKPKRPPPPGRPAVRPPASVVSSPPSPRLRRASQLPAPDSWLPAPSSKLPAPSSELAAHLP